MIRLIKEKKEIISFIMIFQSLLLIYIGTRFNIEIPIYMIRISVFIAILGFILNIIFSEDKK